MTENMSPERSAHLPSKPHLLVAGPVTYAQWQDKFAGFLAERVGKKHGYETEYFTFSHRSSLEEGLYEERGAAMRDKAHNLDELGIPYYVSAWSAGGAKFNELFGNPEEVAAEVERIECGEARITEWDLLKYFDMSNLMAVGYLGGRQREGESFPGYKERYEGTHKGYVDAIEQSEIFAKALDKLYDKVRFGLMMPKDAYAIAMFSVHDPHVPEDTRSLPGMTERLIKIRDLGELTHLVSIGKAYSGDLLPYFDQIRKNRN